MALSSYQVRSRDGGIALDYPSLDAVREAYTLGLIDPEDEVLEVGKTQWRKAKDIALLNTAMQVKAQRRVGSRNQWALAAVAVATLTVALLARGSYASGGICAFITVAILMHLMTLTSRGKG